MSLRFIASVLLCLFLTACVSDGGQRDADKVFEQSPLAGTLSSDSAAEESHLVFGSEDGDDQEDQQPRTERFPGTGEFINEDIARRRPAPSLDADGEITLNFEALSVPEVVQALLGDLLGENYVIGPGVSGEVTFATAKPIGRDQILPILEMVLRWNNAAIVYKDNRYNVLPVSNAVRGNLSPRLGAAGSVQGYEVLVVPLNYIAPLQMQTILEPYVQEGAIISADNARSLIVLAGTRQELGNYLRTIEIFDVDWLEGMSVGVFNLERVEVGEVVPELESIFGTDGESPLAGLFRFVPIERLNSVLVITPQPEYLEQAEQWITRLDRGSAGSAGNRLYVYRVENLEAGVLADYLLDIFGGTRTSGGNDNTGNSLTAGSLGAGLQPVSLSTVNEENEASAQRQNQPTGAAGRNAQSGVALGDTENVRITAIEETNSLLIQASPQQYDSILAAIKRLDSEPLQVLIEAHVVEVVLSEDLQYGVNYFLSNFNPLGGGSDDGSGAGGLANALVSSDANFNSRAATFDGSSTLFSLTNPGNTFFQSVITALESVSETRTISSPTLLVRNNTEASINVGQQLAIANTTFNGLGGVGGTTASTQFVQTGTTLTVTPRVNPGGLVYMQLSQEVSNPIADSTGPNGNPNISTNILTTDVAVQSGQSIILGGLISERYLESEGGIPFLRRIPLLGKLFSTTSYDVDRNEIVVIIKPTVIEAIDELQEVSNELEKNFEGLRPFNKSAELPNEKIPSEFPNIGD